MLDHVILTVSNFKRSVAFYAKALKPLGITNFTDYEGQDGHPNLRGFGDGKRDFFWLKEGSLDPQAVQTPEARARKHLKLGPNTIRAIMRPGCSILTATISRSFIKAKLIFTVLTRIRYALPLLTKRRASVIVNATSS